jgi:hypothetical protein
MQVIIENWTDGTQYDFTPAMVGNVSFGVEMQSDEFGFLKVNPAELKFNRAKYPGYTPQKYDWVWVYQGGQTLFKGQVIARRYSLRNPFEGITLRSELFLILQKFINVNNFIGTIKQLFTIYSDIDDVQGIGSEAQTLINQTVYNGWTYPANTPTNDALYDLGVYLWAGFSMGFYILDGILYIYSLQNFAIDPALLIDIEYDSTVYSAERIGWQPSAGDYRGTGTLNYNFQSIILPTRGAGGTLYYNRNKLITREDLQVGKMLTYNGAPIGRALSKKYQNGVYNYTLETDYTGAP